MHEHSLSGGIRSCRGHCRARYGIGAEACPRSYGFQDREVLRRHRQGGRNDCASTGNNSCGGLSKVNADTKAWIYVPAGYCGTHRRRQPSAEVTRSETVAITSDTRRHTAERTGIGLRLPHIAEVVATRPSVAWLEIHPENFLVNSRRPGTADGSRPRLPDLGSHGRHLDRQCRRDRSCSSDAPSHTGRSTRPGPRVRSPRVVVDWRRVPQ